MNRWPQHIREEMLQWFCEKLKDTSLLWVTKIHELGKENLTSPNKNNIFFFQGEHLSLTKIAAKISKEDKNYLFPGHHYRIQKKLSHCH